MTRVVEAIYEDGVLKPVEALELREQQRVRVTIEPLDGREKGGPPNAGTEDQRGAAVQRLFEVMDQSTLSLTGPLPTRDELHERR